MMGAVVLVLLAGLSLPDIEGKDGTLTPRRAAHVPPNKIVALDRRGRLLGRQHWRERHGHYGRCDGVWDRRHCQT